MAKQIITKLTDDLDGSDADQTIIFGIDGQAFEIDLSDKNAAALRELLNTYQQAGSRAGRFEATRSGGFRQGVSRNGSGSDHANFVANRELNGKIRAWANEVGYHLAERGRIPQHIVDAYHTGKPDPAVVSQIPGMESEPAAEPAEEAKTDKVPARRNRRPAAQAKFSGAKA